MTPLQQEKRGNCLLTARWGRHPALHLASADTQRGEGLHSTERWEWEFCLPTRLSLIPRQGTGWEVLPLRQPPRTPRGAGISLESSHCYLTFLIFASLPLAGLLAGGDRLLLETHHCVIPWAPRSLGSCFPSTTGLMFVL